jgi:hypothetical protein
MVMRNISVYINPGDRTGTVNSLGPEVVYPVCVKKAVF